MGRPTKHIHRRRTSSCDMHRLALQLAISAYERAVKARIIHVVHPNPTIYLPRMDILDDPGSSKVIATFELPGVKSDQITLNLHQQVLYICGRRVPRTLRECLVDPSTETVNQGTVPSGSNFSIDPTKYLRQELRYGPFKREIRLPHGIREGDIMASLRDGLLTVTWPRHSGSTLDAEPLNSATEDERKHAIATSTEED
ncbi:hypothetical protein AX15_000363 [Amanita polypyramis BW_CC]|nr:hypothetical protein AX15_000363 [Amanita polypyramis BW_CC]